MNRFKDYKYQTDKKIKKLEFQNRELIRINLAMQDYIERLEAIFICHIKKLNQRALDLIA